MSGKYGIIVAEMSEKWGGAEKVGKDIVKIFKKHDDEEWEYFKACEGELPDENKLREYKGFVVSGSVSSANDNLPWINELEEFFRTVNKLPVTDSPKLVGICFGHQLINKAFGASVIQNRVGRFVLHKNDINISKELQEKEFYKSALGGKSKLNLIESHSEEVINLPPSAKCLASSEDCENEIVLYDNNKILTFQGHSEISEDDVKSKIFPSLLSKGKMDDERVKIFWESMDEKVNNSEECVALIRSFIG